MDSLKPRAASPSAGVAALVFALAVLFVFADFLGPHTHLILSEGHQDLDTQILWWRQFGFSELVKGHLALWIPHLFCGTPFFGYLQPALLYPPNWLYMVWPLPFTVNFLIALHVFLAGWFTTLWILKRGHSLPPGLLAGFMVMFGAALFLRIVPGHLLNLSAMPWTPLTLLAIEGYRQEKTPGWILLGVWAVGMQVLSGQMQLFYYSALFTAAYAFFPLPAQGKKSFLLGAFGMGLGGLLIGSVQLLAGWDAAHESLRGSGMTLDVASSTPMPAERLWCLLAPNFYGDWKNYWGAGLYWEGVCYVGLTGFVLALVGFQSNRPQKKFFVWAFFLLALVALGRRTFLFALCYHALPLFNHFRGVAKLDFWMTLCLAALAAMGFEEILENPKKLKGLMRLTAIGAGVFLFLALIVKEIAQRGEGGHFARYLPYAGAMIESLLVGAWLLGLNSLVAWTSLKRPAFRYAFLLLACVELLAFALDNRPFFDVQALQQKIDPLRQVYRLDPGDYRVLADSRNYALGTGGMDIWGYDTNIPSRYARFVALTQPCDTNDFLKDSTLRRVSPALGLVGLRYVFNDAGDHLTVSRLHLKEAPRFFVDDQWEIVSQDQALQNDARAGFDPLKEVFLESDPGLSPKSGKLKSEVHRQDLSSDLIRLDVKLSKPAVLVLDENYSAGWKALALPGSAQAAYRVVPADGFLRAVALGSGEHHFLLQYRPTAFVVGKWISIVSLGLFLALSAWWAGVCFFRPRKI